LPWLTVVDRRHQRQRELPITRASFTVGKRNTCDLVLDRDNISREHCRITHTKQGALLEDLKSRNGTFTKSGKVKGSVPLRDGEVIYLGDFVVTYHARGGEHLQTHQQTQSAMPAARHPAASPPAGRTPQPSPTPSQYTPNAQAATALQPKRGGAIPAVARDRRLHTPVELKRKIHDKLITDLDLKHIDITKQSPEELSEKTRKAVESIVRGLGSEVPVWVSTDLLVKEVVDEAVGLGPIEGLLADETVDEIMVNNWDRIYVERKGRLELCDLRFTDNRQVLNVIRRILAPIGRRIDESSPMVDARLADGSRVNAIISPLSLKGPTLTIRKFSTEPFTIDDMVRFGTLTREEAMFLELCVKSRRNILISGGTGSGKTTLLNVVSNFIPGEERIITIEDAAELKLPQEHVVSLESKPPNIEGKGAIPIRKLVINSLRMRPNRIVIGECRGGEALDMLQAMNTGHDGSLTTIHANSPRDTLSRLETLVLMAGLELPARAIREQIASAINLIVQTARMPDGTRKVTCIAEITGMEGDVITMQDLFVFRQTGVGANGEVEGYHDATGAVPKFIHDLQQRGISVDMTMFTSRQQRDKDSWAPV